jgi:hypothetical protein
MRVCPSYGPKGCRCTFGPGHAGDHGHNDADGCTWKDCEAISKPEADAMLIARAGPLRGRLLIQASNLAEAMLSILGE